MKQPAAVQIRENNRILHRSRLLPQPAVWDELHSPNRATPNGSESHFSHDFSHATVRSAAPLVGQNYATTACPMFPQRCPFGGACHACLVGAQTKLKIGLPGDKYEQEADRVADQVMRRPEPGAEQETEISESSRTASNLQRSLTKQAGPTTMPPNVHGVLPSPGQPIDSATRTFFEPRFGYDFSRVRIHTNNRASETAQRLNARAFAIGEDIYFNQGEYDPKHMVGRRLIAHELTHVLQRRNIISRYHAVYRRAILEPDQSTHQIRTRSAIRSHGRYTHINHFRLLGPDVFRFRFRFNFLPDPSNVHIRLRSGLRSVLPFPIPRARGISRSFSGRDLVFVLDIPIGSEWSIQLDDPPPFEWRRKIISEGRRIS